MTSTITLQHDDVNGGTEVDMVVDSIKYGWKNISKRTPTVNRRDIAEVDVATMENPIINMTGYIDIDNTTNKITQSLLLDFALASVSSDLVLTIKIDSPDGATLYIYGRPSTGYDATIPRTYSNTINVWIDSFDINLSSRVIKEGKIWMYSITLVETA